jgi:hypothetical protein
MSQIAGLRKMHRWAWRGAVALALGVGGVTGASARITGLLPANYVGNTLIGQNTANGARCRLWLNVGGSYQILYDHGQPAVPFRFEGRAGTYVTSIGLSGRSVCLTPDSAPDWRYRIEQEREIYGGSGCYKLPAEAVGQSWTLTDGAAHSYRMWLVKGR